MELKEFIKETLVQISEGIVSAQNSCKSLNAVINPSWIDNADKGKTKVDGVNRVVSKILFEVALTSSDGTADKAGIGVLFGSFGIGGQKETDTQNISVTSVKFDISVVWPSIETKTTSKPPRISKLSSDHYVTM